MSGHPPRSGPVGKPAVPSKNTPLPTEWRIELPESGAAGDAEFGGCRSIEAGYDRGKVLGQGTYGEVYLATDLQTQELVAAKKIKMDNEKEGFPITAIREIKILSALAAAKEEVDRVLLRNNVIGLREIVRSGSHKANNFKGSIYMIFDYMDHDMTGLLERSKEGRRFTAAQIKCYLKQLFCGLALLANYEVLHRDLKNANLLVNNAGELKIADFGLARYFHKSGQGGGGAGGGDGRLTNRVITLWYRPPELFLGSERYGTEIDMWSAGCIMFELLTGKPLFPGKDEGDQLDRICSVVGRPTETSMPGCTSYPNYATVGTGTGNSARWPMQSKLRQHCESRGVTDKEALDLLEKLLALNPAARISAHGAVTHSYFFSSPLPCKPSDMPKFPSSHEMTMKRARHEQRHGGGQQQQQRQQQQGQAQHQRQQQQQQQAGPQAQRLRTSGQYGGPQQQVQQQGQQQPYRGGGRGGAPAVGAAMGGSMRMPGAVGGGVMPVAGQAPIILNQAQAQQFLAQQGGIVTPGMLQHGAAGGPGFAHAQGGLAGRGMGASGPYGIVGRMGGGAQPSWENQRR